MTRISTHVLDTVAGMPVAGVEVWLEHVGDERTTLATARTDDDGRVAELADVGPGTYRLGFATAGRSAFFPEVRVTFVVDEGRAHLHVPLLLSPYGYTTYRGS